MLSLGIDPGSYITEYTLACQDDLEGVSVRSPRVPRRHSLTLNRLTTKTIDLPTHLWQTSPPPLSRNHCLCWVASLSRLFAVTLSLSRHVATVMSLYFPVTCYPSRAVTLPNIGVPHYIKVPHRAAYPSYPHSLQQPGTGFRMQVVYCRHDLKV